MTYPTTVYGDAIVDRDVDLRNLRIGDLVLGTPSPDMQVRTLYRVVGEFGHHRVPQEPPVSLWERATSLLDGKDLGVLVELAGVDGGRYPAMFTAERTPTVDRVTGWWDSAAAAAGPVLNTQDGPFRVRRTPYMRLRLNDEFVQRDGWTIVRVTGWDDDGIMQVEFKIDGVKQVGVFNPSRPTDVDLIVHDASVDEV